MALKRVETSSYKEMNFIFIFVMLYLAQAQISEHWVMDPTNHIFIKKCPVSF